jgi:hypothetical protein
MSSRPSDRLRVRRNTKKGRYDRERIERRLDRARRRADLALDPRRLT